MVPTAFNNFNRIDPYDSLTRSGSRVKSSLQRIMM